MLEYGFSLTSIFPYSGIFYVVYQCTKSACTRSFSDWMQRYTEYLSVVSPNTGKYGPQKLWIWTLFTQCTASKQRVKKQSECVWNYTSVLSASVSDAITLCNLFFFFFQILSSSQYCYNNFFASILSFYSFSFTKSS